MAYRSSAKRRERQIPSARSENVDRLNKYMSLAGMARAKENDQADGTVPLPGSLVRESLWDYLIDNFGEIRIVSLLHLLQLTNTATAKHSILIKSARRSG